MKKIKVSLILFFLLITLQTQASTQLVVYTAVEPEELAAFGNAFQQEYPDIKIAWVRLSTGILTAKLLAEGENTHADMVWGVAASSLLLLDQKNLLSPYSPKKLEHIKANLKDQQNPPKWVGQRAWINAICFNTVEAKKHALPIPNSWQDLTKPVYKGHIVMPNPASSGTGYSTVSSWFQIFGEKKAWEFMDGLHKNIGLYTHSGSKPCKMAGKGEFPIGISFAYNGAKLKKRGAPILVVAPTEGLGWDLESFGIIKGTKKMEAAKKFADWSVTKKANQMYNQNYAFVAMPGVAKPVKHFPKNIENKMIDNNFNWAASNRKRILKNWEARYGSKSAAKN